MTSQKLVMIEWLDSSHTAGWSRGRPGGESLLIRSVGWLVRDGKKAKTVAPHVSHEKDPQMAGVMTIPSCSIVSIRQLN